VSDFDIKKTAETVADFLSGYFEQFVLILTKPRTTLSAEFSRGVQGKKRIQRAIIYASSSILVGICLARFIELPKSPAEVNPQTAIAVLFIWILSATLLHPILKLFRAKGNLQDTIIVFLFIISTLHLLFIPILTILSRTITETQVTLTYEYVIYFGGSREGEDWGPYVETYVKEREPERDKTILPPLSDSNARDIPKNPEMRARVDPSTLAIKAPKRTEAPIVRKEAQLFLLFFWVFYYLANSTYLAIGLSIAHKQSPYYLFVLAVFGLPILLGFMLIASILMGLFIQSH